MLTCSTCGSLAWDGSAACPACGSGSLAPAGDEPDLRAALLLLCTERPALLDDARALSDALGDACPSLAVNAILVGALETALPFARDGEDYVRLALSDGRWPYPEALVDEVASALAAAVALADDPAGFREARRQDESGQGVWEQAASASEPDAVDPFVEATIQYISDAAFDPSRRGYDWGEVDAFLDELVDRLRADSGRLSLGRLLIDLDAVAFSPRSPGYNTDEVDDFISHLASSFDRELIERGNAEAQHRDGRACEEDRGVRQEHAEAARLCRKAADQGDARAQYRLGLTYTYGHGVRRDHAEAARWYRKAADQGYAASQCELGNIYQEGRGVPQDYAEAARWYRKAADQGYAVAQFELGNMYHEGRGVPRDFAEAKRWWRLAAEQDLAAAKWALTQ